MLLIAGTAAVAWWLFSKKKELVKDGESKTPAGSTPLNQSSTTEKQATSEDVSILKKTNQLESKQEETNLVLQNSKQRTEASAATNTSANPSQTVENITITTGQKEITPCIDNALKSETEIGITNPASTSNIPNGVATNLPAQPSEVQSPSTNRPQIEMKSLPSTYNNPPRPEVGTSSASLAPILQTSTKNAPGLQVDSSNSNSPENDVVTAREIATPEPNLCTAREITATPDDASKDTTMVEPE